MPREQDFEGLRAAGSPDKVGLLAALAEYIEGWMRVLAVDAMPSKARILELNQRATELEQRSVSVGFGGLRHHLAEYTRLLTTGAEPRALRAQLGIVMELASQAKQTLSPTENAALSASVSPAQAVGRGAGAVAAGLAPPPLITVMRQADPALAEAFRRPAPDMALPHRVEALQPILGPPAAAPAPGLAAPGPQAPAPAAPGPPRVAAPQFGVKNMLGLRAFGKGHRAERAEASPVKAKPSAPAGPLLSLPPLANGVPAAGAPRPSTPPRLDRSELLSLPPLPQRNPSGYPGEAQLPAPLEQRASPPHGTPVRPLGRRPLTARPEGPRQLRARPETRSVGLWVGGAGALVLLGTALVAFFVFARRPAHALSDARPDGSPAVVPDAGAASASQVAVGAAPRERLLVDHERFMSLLAQVHGHGGGTESPEMRSLLDEQAALASKALSGNCDDGSPKCKAWSNVRDLIVGDRRTTVVKRRRGSDTETTRSGWMTGLKMPGIPVEDDPRVQRVFEFYTENPVGRETFQSMLFRCGAYRDLIQSTLIRYDLPPELMALAFTESGCEPSAKSPVGAAGLWQFMPETARAYHLNIVEGTIDERYSPFKSTEAGIRYLADLRLKLGSWDLVFASYDLGPFGVLARLEKAGPDASFWDLVDADLLPDETANYAPSVDAIALILANLQRLKFAGVQIRAPQMTADLEVAGGTRLSLVARAAATSFNQLHALNLDFSGDVVPVIPGGPIAVQVPKDVVWQARDTLKDLLASKDGADQCVSATFDWGKQRFTPEMDQACQKRLSASH